MPGGGCCLAGPTGGDCVHWSLVSLRGRCHALKFQAPSTKSQTNSNDRNSNVRNELVTTLTRLRRFAAGEGHRVLHRSHQKTSSHTSERVVPGFLGLEAARQKPPVMSVPSEAPCLIEVNSSFRRYNLISVAPQRPHPDPRLQCRTPSEAPKIQVPPAHPPNNSGFMRSINRSDCGEIYPPRRITTP